ncbi:MAG: M20/M25/M40 family metallo-hydrolase [Actinobacteria bacterium]|jgi:glutamate carboxypeptidase|nr:M20/M25/M40 family metallo-hydrolase [Actinomycetota bacterium]
MTIIQDLKALVEFESPSEDLGACRGVVDLAVGIANKNLSVKAEVIEENGRPVFWWGSKNPEIILLAHLDTVWPKNSFKPLWQESGDVVKGPGIFDMKAGFLQALYAIKEIPGAESKVALIATTDEELGSQSSKELIKSISSKAKAVLVLEASLNGKVKTGRKGTSMYQIKIHGRASHAGLEPEKGINATVEISRIVSELAKLENPEHGTTVVPTTLHSGTTTNTVPALAVLDLDIRSFLSSELNRIDTAIKLLAAQNPEARIEITGGINRPPLEISSTKALYEKLEAVAKSIGMDPIGHASVGGASDGNFAAAAGAQVLDGLGAVGDGAHAPHEQILLSSIPTRVTLLTAFIKELIRD